MKKLFTFLFFFTLSSSFSQSVTCNELLTFIKNNGYIKSTVSSYTLNSSWLNKVTAYDYDYKTYVVAEIKESQYSYNTKTYIFCNIPSNNWSQFQYSIYDNSSTYGERFNKYIMDYRCNCN